MSSFSSRGVVLGGSVNQSGAVETSGSVGGAIRTGGAIVTGAGLVTGGDLQKLPMDHKGLYHLVNGMNGHEFESLREVASQISGFKHSPMWGKLAVSPAVVPTLAYQTIIRSHTPQLLGRHLESESLNQGKNMLAQATRHSVMDMVKNVERIDDAVTGSGFNKIIGSVGAKAAKRAARGAAKLGAKASAEFSDDALIAGAKQFAKKFSKSGAQGLSQHISTALKWLGGSSKSEISGAVKGAAAAATTAAAALGGAKVLGLFNKGKEAIESQFSSDDLKILKRIKDKRSKLL